jgi:hypothetical protein
MHRRQLVVGSLTYFCRQEITNCLSCRKVLIDFRLLGHDSHVFQRVDVICEMILI